MNFPFGQQIFVDRKHFKSIRCISILILLLINNACNTTETNPKKAPKTVNAIVYGKVVTQENRGINRAKVRLTQYPEGCSKDSLYTSLEFTFTDESGEYLIVYHIGGKEEVSCFKAQVELPDTSDIIAPKPKIFEVDFRPKPPYDSVKVDFVLQNSMY